MPAIGWMFERRPQIFYFKSGQVLKDGKFNSTYETIWVHFSFYLVLILQDKKYWIQLKWNLISCVICFVQMNWYRVGVILISWLQLEEPNAWKMTIINSKPSQKSIKKNTNSKPSNTQLYKERGGGMYLGGVCIYCQPDAPALWSLSRSWKKKKP